MSLPRVSPVMRRLREELPFVLGCLVACGLLARPGMVFFGQACGSDWPTYLENAARLWHPERTELVYQDWRKPLHALLVGLAGEPLGYVRGAQWLTLVATVATVLGAGLLGRSLGSRTVGVLAALVVALLPSLEQSGRWVNLYPLLAGLGALALGLAAACLRWPRWELGGLAGLAGGLAWACDDRGVGPLVLSLLAVLAAVVTVRSKGWWAAAILAAALVGAGAGWGLDQGLQARLGLTTRSLQQQVAVQSEVSMGPNVPVAVRQACAPERLESLGGLRFGRDCARELLPHNWAELVSFEALPPPWWLLLLLPALLPARWGRRSSAGVALLLGGSAAALVAGMAVVAYPERYALLQLVAMAALLPVGLERLVERLVPMGSPRLGGRVALVVAVLVVMGWVWPRFWPVSRTPAAFCREAGIPIAGLEPERQAVLAWMRRSLQPKDLLLDCSNSSFDELALPRRLPLREARPGGDTCSRWVRSPPVVEGTVWLVTTVDQVGLAAMLPESEEELSGLGWTLEPLPEVSEEAGGVLRLWHR